ncbi:MAG: glycosyltransferase family 4 protein [Pseudomonadota bacterium]
MGRNVAVVLKGYPRLSETFIAQELLELERAGLKLRLVSLRHPTDKDQHPIHGDITAEVSYLPEYLHREPLRVIKACWHVIQKHRFGRAFRAFLSDFRHDVTRNRLRRFGQSLVMAHELPDKTQWLYAHFIHTPGSVAYYTHLLTGIPWSCSAHAKDIWTTPDWELSRKLDNASWTVTCTQSGYEHLKALSKRKDTVHMAHHGIDLGRFPANNRPPSLRNGSNPADPVRIITVGRAVEKKGLDTLVDALAMLPDDLNWKWTHIGGGVLSGRLSDQIARLGLADRAVMLGSKPQQFILRCYRDSDFFVLPCRIAADGDRDGLPNVLLEAQSQGLACISSPISGVVELIEDGRNGLLVDPDETGALAKAIESLARDPEMRVRMGKSGADTVRSDFDHRSEIGIILKLFDISSSETQHNVAAQ